MLLAEPRVPTGPGRSDRRQEPERAQVLRGQGREPLLVQQAQALRRVPEPVLHEERAVRTGRVVPK